MSIDLEVSIKDLQFIATLLRGAGAQKQWTDEAAKTKKASDDLDRSLDRMAASVQKMHATPLEKYQREVQKLDLLLSKAKISQDLHTRAVNAAKLQYDQATQSVQKFNQAGQGSATDIASSLGVVTSAAAAAALAVQQIGAGFQYAQDQAKRAADEMDKLFALRRTLNQVAKSPEHLQEMITRADAGAAQYGVTREQSHAIMADVVGLGIENEYDTIMAANAGAVAAPDASRMVKKLLAIYKQKDPQLTARSSIDMTLEAARKSELSFEDLSAGVAQASEGGVVVGSSAEETISALSVLGGKFASVQTAADRIKGFSARAGTDERLKGKGLIGAFRTLRDEFSAEDRKKFLGESQELNVMYEYLSQFENDIVARQQEVGGARRASDSGQGAVQQALARAGKTPQLAATVAKQQAENRLKIVEETALGGFGQRQQQALADVQTSQLQQDNFAFQRYGAYAGARTAMFLGQDETGIGAGGQLGQRAVESVAAGPVAPLYLGFSLFMDAVKEFSSSTKRKPPIHSAAQIEAAQQIN